MARLLTTGAEVSGGPNGSLGAGVFGLDGDTALAGQQLTRDTGTFRSGVASFRANNAGTTTAQFNRWISGIVTPFGTMVTDRNYYARTYFNFSTFPTVDDYALLAFANSTGNVVTAYFDISDNSIGMWLAGVKTGSRSSAITTNQWYRLELGFDNDQTAASGYGEILLDGVSVTSSTTLTYSATIADRVQVGKYHASGAAETATCYFDDIALNDDQGANENTWPGSGKVVLLKPVSDAQDGSWVGGAGGTGDLSLAVTNTPPVGVVSGSATNTSQIETNDASGDNSTDEYRANLTTYTNAGIGGADTIKLIQSFVNHGEDIATNTKTGSCGFQSNPTETYGTFTYGNDVGAVGTWPSNWRWFLNAVIYSPSVTRSSNPVLALRKTDAGTRFASADFLGAYCEYLPVSGLPPDGPEQVLQAVNRSNVY